MVSGIFSFDLSILNKNGFYFDQKIMKMMPMMPISSSNFGKMGMCIQGVTPLPVPDYYNLIISLRVVMTTSLFLSVKS